MRLQVAISMLASQLIKLPHHALVVSAGRAPPLPEDADSNDNATCGRHRCSPSSSPTCVDTNLNSAPPSKFYHNHPAIALLAALPCPRRGDDAQFIPCLLRRLLLARLRSGVRRNLAEASLLKGHVRCVHTRRCRTQRAPSTNRTVPRTSHSAQ